MRAVYVGIRHDDDSVVAKFFDIKIFMDTGPERCDHRSDLRVSEDPVQSCLLNIQDLAAKRQDRLGRPGSCRLGGPACGISLNDKDLAVFTVLVRTVGQLAGKTQSVQSALSARQISCLSCRGSGSLGHNGLLDDDLADLRMLLQIDRKALAQQTLDSASCLGIAQLLLRLAFKLRLADLDRYDRCETFTDVITGQILFTVLEKLLRPAVIIERLGQRVAEAGHMCSAFRSDDIIDK